MEEPTELYIKTGELLHLRTVWNILKERLFKENKGHGCQQCIFLPLLSNWSKNQYCRDYPVGFGDK